MGKYERKRKKSPGKALLTAVLLAAVAAAFVLFALPRILYLAGDDGEEYREAAPAASEQTAESGDVDSVPFPVSLEEGRLEILSVFPFEGINPDAGNRAGKDTAALTLKNASDVHLEAACVTVTLADGTEHCFQIRELPPGKSVMAFCTENMQLPDGYACAKIDAVCSFAEAALEEGITLSVEGTQITLTNVSGEDMENVVVYCRDVLDETYFGGMAYLYTIDRISAGESTTVTASDSLMGVIEVVRIAVDH